MPMPSVLTDPLPPQEGQPTPNSPLRLSQVDLRDHLGDILEYSCMGALARVGPNWLPRPSGADAIGILATSLSRRWMPSPWPRPYPRTEQWPRSVGGDRGWRVGCPPRPFSDSWDSVLGSLKVLVVQNGRLWTGRKRALARRFALRVEMALLGPIRPAARAGFGPATGPTLPRAARRCPLR